MKDLSYYRERLRDLDWLAGPDLEGKCVMDSSLNQRMGLRDQCEGDQTWHVPVDYQGSGCLTRFWTAGDSDGELELFFDWGQGASHPHHPGRVLQRPALPVRHAGGDGLRRFEPGEGLLSALPLQPGVQGARLQRYGQLLLADQRPALRAGGGGADPAGPAEGHRAELPRSAVHPLEEDHGFPPGAPAERVRVAIPRRSEAVLL